MVHHGGGGVRGLLTGSGDDNQPDPFLRRHVCKCALNIRGEAIIGHRDKAD